MKQSVGVWLLCSAVGLPLLISACSRPDYWDNPPVRVEYMVYSAVIDSLLRIETEEYPPRKVVILNRSNPAWTSGIGLVLRNVNRREELVDSLVIERFIQVNSSPAALRDSFEAPYDIEVVPPDSLCPVPLTDDYRGWDCLRDHYPRAEGLVVLFRAAFDERQRIALVLAGFEGRFWANYFYFVVEASDDRWTITRMVFGPTAD